MKGIGKEKIRATAEQLVTLDHQLHNTIFDFFYERDGKPPACTPEAVIRFLSFFIDLREIRRLFAENTLNEVKEIFKEVIYRTRLKFWNERTGLGNAIMNSIGWVYDFKFTLNPPVEDLLSRVKEAIFWQVVEEVEIIKVKKENFFVPSLGLMADFVDRRKHANILKNEGIMREIWEYVSAEFGRTDSTSLENRIKNVLPKEFVAAKIIYRNLLDLFYIVITNCYYQQEKCYEPMFQLYRDGNFPLGFRNTIGEDNIKQKLLVLCEG